MNRDALPTWLRRGAICYVSGEGDDVYRVVDIRDGVALLEYRDSRAVHGWESIAKLHLGELCGWPPLPQPSPPKTWDELKAEKKAKRKR